MERVSEGLTMYHLTLGPGIVRKVSREFIIVKYSNGELAYGKRDVGFSIFFSKKEMFTHFSKVFKLSDNTIEVINNKVIASDKLSLEYYKIFDCIFENKDKRYYRFVFESMEWLITNGHISIYSSFDSEKVRKAVENYLENKCYSYAVRLSICYSNDSLLRNCCKTYMSVYENNLDKALKLLRLCIKSMFKFHPLSPNKSGTLKDLHIIILNLIFEFGEEDYLLMKLEEPLFDQFIEALSSNVSEKSFKDLLKYYCRYHKEGDYATLLDNLIKYASHDPQAKQLLDIFIDTETKKIKNVNKVQAAIVGTSTIQIKELLPIILKERGITELLHFTNINNLPSIIACGGLWPRSKHEELEIVAEYSDEMRLENRLNATSFSISFPNYRMLYQKLKQYRYDYAILVFDPMLLYKENEKAFFCYSNAASNNGRMLSGPDIKSFNRIFDTKLRKSTVPQNYPTNSQAEILIEGAVNIKYLKEIHVKSDFAKEKLCRMIDDQDFRNKIQVNSFYFNYENGKNIWEAEELLNGQTHIF